MKTRTSRKSGFTLVEIMIIVAIIGLLVAIVIPNFVRAKQTAQKNTCVENLRLLKIGQNAYAREYGISSGAILSAQDIRHLEMGKKKCPAGGTYTINAVGADPVCSLQDQGHVLSVKAPKAP